METIIRRILDDVPKGEEFYFYEGIGKQVRESPADGSQRVRAAGLEDFRRKVETVSVKYLEYHFERGDFNRWVYHSIWDTELNAMPVKLKQDFNPSGETLRTWIERVLFVRIGELKAERRN